MLGVENIDRFFFININVSRAFQQTEFYGEDFFLFFPIKLLKTHNTNNIPEHRL